MVNIKKEENKKEGNNIKEEAKELLDDQRQQLKNTTTSTISESRNKIDDNINEYQKINKVILAKSIDISNKYQQETIKAIQLISNNYNELQKNILNTYQSAFSEFLDNISKSNWNNFRIPKRYADNVYNKTNQNITDTINCTRRLNNFVLRSTQTFSKSIEIAQKYYNESAENYVHFVNKMGKSYYNQ